MTKTSLDIITEALRIINVADQNGSYPAEIKARADIRYAAMHEYLSSELKVGWTAEDVPDKYQDHVSGILAGRLAKTIPSADFDKARLIAAESEKELRQLLAKKPRKTVQLPVV